MLYPRGRRNKEQRNADQPVPVFREAEHGTRNTFFRNGPEHIFSMPERGTFRRSGLKILIYTDRILLQLSRIFTSDIVVLVLYDICV